MQSLSVIKELLASRGLQPRHRLGQNFLHDKNQLQRLLAAAGVTQGHLVLEVGPGTGTLTESLLERGARVIACELDQGLADLIEEHFAQAMSTPASHEGSLRLIRGDALEKGRRLNAEAANLVGDEPFVLVANLPYQIASPLIAALLMDHPNCRGMFVTIQKEVALRLTAQPVTKEYGSLGIIVQALATVDVVATLGPGCFWPPPEVTSAMVSIVPRNDVDESLRSSEARRAFGKFVTELFTRRRKQLGGAFGKNRNDWPAGIDPTQRPESLTVDQVVALWKWAGVE